MSHNEPYESRLCSEETHVQLTLRCNERALEQRLRDVAREEGISLNQVAIRLLRRGAGLDSSSPSRQDHIGTRLDHLAGTWTARQAQEVEDALRLFEAIDEELWR